MRQRVAKITADGVALRGRLPKGHRFTTAVIANLGADGVARGLALETRCRCGWHAEHVFGGALANGILDPEWAGRILDAHFADLYDAHLGVRGPSPQAG